MCIRDRWWVAVGTVASFQAASCMDGNVYDFSAYSTVYVHMYICLISGNTCMSFSSGLQLCTAVLLAYRVVFVMLYCFCNAAQWWRLHRNNLHNSSKWTRTANAKNFRGWRPAIHAWPCTSTKSFKCMNLLCNSAMSFGRSAFAIGIMVSRFLYIF